MKQHLTINLVAIMLVAAPALYADEYGDYLAALDREFAVTKQEGPVQVTVRPRLIERRFAEEVRAAQEGNKLRTDIVKEWTPIHKGMMEDGYVFEVKYYLVNQNLDAGIEIQFHGDWRNNIVLINNNDVTTRLYRTTGEETPQLDFMYPERIVLCYFNTCDEQKQPLIARGVQSLKLVIGKFCDELPEMEFSWALPLWYGDVARPTTLSSWFGGRQLRTLWPYKDQIYNPPIRSPQRIERSDAGAEGEAPAPTGKAAAPAREGVPAAAPAAPVKAAAPAAKPAAPAEAAESTNAPAAPNKATAPPPPSTTGWPGRPAD